MRHTFYRVFRYGVLGPPEMKLAIPSDKAPVWYNEKLHTQADGINLLRRLYPDGISWHGQNYLFDRYYYTSVDNKEYVNQQPMLEMAYELVRLALFPGLPSRLTSFYAFELLEEAKHFQQQYCSGQGDIHRVSCDSYFRFDMNLLRLGAGIPSTLVMAEHYWRGEASDSPCWEILMQGPVSILERVA
jgi:hypothetical protein